MPVVWCPPLPLWCSRNGRVYAVCVCSYMATRFVESHWFVWITQMNHIPMVRTRIRSDHNYPLEGTGPPPAAHLVLFIFLMEKLVL